MELVANIIIEYLKHNKRIVVPKLGAFIVKRPEGRVIFSELMRGDDNTLRSLLVAYGMSEIEANGHIDRWVFEIRHAVGSGESFTIENFGLFYAGENNNILFKQKRESMTIGGNIRPPFEKLNEAKRQMRRVRRIEDEQVEVRRSVAKQRNTKRAEEEIVNLTKPESYLRGLRYENKKSKGHDDDYYRNDSRIKLDRRMVVIIAALFVVGVTIWLIWHFTSGDDAPATENAVVTNVAPKVMPQDSTQMAEVAVMETDSVDSLKNENVVL